MANSKRLRLFNLAAANIFEAPTDSRFLHQSAPRTTAPGSPPPPPSLFCCLGILLTIMATGFCYFVAAALRHTVNGKKEKKRTKRPRKASLNEKNDDRKRIE